MKHPVQPLETVGGLAHFKKNSVVEFLVNAGAFDMQDLLARNFPQDDLQQVAQLLGYKPSAYAGLPVADQEVCAKAEEAMEYMDDSGLDEVRLETDDGDWRDIGMVSVDSGQLLLTDPCYVSMFKSSMPRARLFKHADGSLFYCVRHGTKPDENAKSFEHFDVVLPEYGRTPNDLIAEGLMTGVPATDSLVGEYSYPGCCETSCGESMAGPLRHAKGHEGAGVVFATGFGDGYYPVEARYLKVAEGDERIAEVRVRMIAD